MKILDKNDNFDEIINEDMVLVDFFADWCGPCKMLVPVLEQLSSEYKIVKVNVDNFEELARKYGIMSIPNLILFKNGKIVDSKIGYQDYESLKEWLSKN